MSEDSSNNVVETTSAQAQQSAQLASATVNVPQNVRNMHNKGLAALERDNIDFAIDMFFRCIELTPGYLAARRNLRLASVAQFKRARKGALAHKIASIKGFPLTVKVEALLKANKPQEALIAAERLLLMDPLHVGFGRLFGKASLAADLPEAGIMTLEIMREHSPSNIDIVEALGRLYHATKNYRAARDCLEKVFLLKPGNAEIDRLLKDSEALVTLDSGWVEAEREGKSFQAVLANKEQAAQLERSSKAVKSEEDAEALIEEARAKIIEEPNNLNYRLNLGHLLMQQKRFEEAIQVYEEAREANPADPELDRRLNNATTARYDAEIAGLKQAGEAEAAAALETERNQYVFDELSDRVQRYPNDLRLRYELGQQYFQYEHYDEAIQQFQLSQRSPKDRVQSLYHLALCFKHKNLLDMASMQLEQALELLPSMNQEKIGITYDLAEIYQAEGKLDEASELFKEIYRVDVTFRDIGKKIEEIYAAQKSAEK